MRIRRFVHSSLLLLLLVIALMPAASAQRACIDALRYCNGACDERYGGSNLYDGLSLGGCRTGCGIGYLYCVMAN